MPAARLEGAAAVAAALLDRLDVLSARSALFGHLCLADAALSLDDQTIADMARAGLRRIGDIALRPRAPITARFGPARVMITCLLLTALQRRVGPAAATDRLRASP